jgi:hypothetical protein
LQASYAFPRALVLLAGLVLSAVAGPAAAQTVVVTPTVTPSGALFHYDYSVTNNGSFDLAIVNVNVAADPTAIQNISAPTGFQIIFDAGLGILSFLEDFDPGTPETFGPGLTISGFAFDSPFGPQPSTFDALDIVGDTYFGDTDAPLGSTTSPVVPEPFSLALFTAGLLPAALHLRRRDAAA